MSLADTYRQSNLLVCACGLFFSSYQNRLNSLLHHKNTILHMLWCAVNNSFSKRGTVVAIDVWLLDLQLPIQSVPITTKVVSLNPVHGEVYLIQHYVIKFVSDLRQISGFLWGLQFPPPIKLITMIYR